MRDAYLYDDCGVLKNLLGIKDKALFDEAEAGYVTFRLKEVVLNPLQGNACLSTESDLFSFESAPLCATVHRGRVVYHL